MRCRHRDKYGEARVGQVSKQTGKYVGARCIMCGAWLSLGPSNDKPETVQIEIRAAELAANGGRLNLPYGVNILEHPEWLAMILATRIANHDAEGES